MKRKGWKPQERRTIRSGGKNLKILQLVRPGYIGKGDYLCDNAISVRMGYCYNGSGKQSFGGADHWASVDAEVPFQEGQEKLRNRFAEELMDFIDRFMEEHTPLGGGLRDRRAAVQAGKTKTRFTR